MIYILLNPLHDIIPTEYQKNFFPIYTCKAMGSSKYTVRTVNIETDATQYLTNTL